MNTPTIYLRVLRRATVQDFSTGDTSDVVTFATPEGYEFSVEMRSDDVDALIASASTETPADRTFDWGVARRAQAQKTGSQQGAGSGALATEVGTYAGEQKREVDVVRAMQETDDRWSANLERASGALQGQEQKAPAAPPLNALRSALAGAVRTALVLPTQAPEEEPTGSGMASALVAAGARPL